MSISKWQKKKDYPDVKNINSYAMVTFEKKFILFAGFARTVLKGQYKL